MNSIYLWVRNNMENPLRKRLLEMQPSWLKDRNDCDGDVKCLKSVYDQRFSELRTIDLPS